MYGDDMEYIINNHIIMKLIFTIITIVLSVVLYKLITNFIIKKMGREEDTNKKINTYKKLIKNIFRSVFIILAFLFILQIFGINISSVIAGVGVLGVVFGLAIQDWLKDIIRGSSILSDNYFAVGDVVRYKNIEGKVLILGLKTTKMQDLKTSNIISIANRNIDEIEVVSNFIYVRVPIGYDVKLKTAEKAIKEIVSLVKTNQTVIDCKYIGVTELADSSIQYLLKVTCDPSSKLQANRDTLRSIIVGLERNNLEVPFNQIDVHQK